MQDTTHLPEAARMRLRLTGPRHGWLTVEWELGTFVLHVSASLVLNNPMRELFDMLTCHRLSSGSFRRVCLWAEPEGYAVDVQSLDDQLFMVTVWFDKAFVPPMSGRAMTLQHRCLVKRTLFSQGLLDGLAEWLASEANPSQDLSGDELAGFRSALRQVQHEIRSNMGQSGDL